MKRLAEFDTAIGTANLGDEIILQSFRKEMEALYRECFILRFGTHLINFSALRYILGGRKIEFLNNADYKIIAGTNLLSRNIKKTSGQWPVNGFQKYLYEDSILAGVGLTLEPGRPTRKTVRFYHKTLRRDFVHSVRDDESKKFLESMGFSAINTGCPTLWSITKELCEKIPKKKAKRVVFSISGFTKQQNSEYDQKLIDILRSEYEDLFFWCQAYLDEEYFDTFEDTANIKRIYSLKEFADLLDTGDIDYVGTRLHGGIMAIQHGVWTIVIAIDQRARGFHQSNNLAICERKEIAGKLPEMIESTFETKIIVNHDAIDRWKKQFCEEHMHNKQRNRIWLKVLRKGLRIIRYPARLFVGK